MIAVCLPPLPQAEAVIFAGSNQVSNLAFVTSRVAALQAAFLDHPMDRMGLLSRARVYTQCQHSALAVNGALGVAVELAKSTV